MFISKLKIVAVLVLTAGILGSKTGWVFQDGNGIRAQQPEEKRSEPEADGFTKERKRLHDAIREAQAMLVFQQKNFERLRKLIEQNAVGKTDVDRTFAELESAREKLYVVIRAAALTAKKFEENAATDAAKAKRKWANCQLIVDRFEKLVAAGALAKVELDNAVADANAAAVDAKQAEAVLANVREFLSQIGGNQALKGLTAKSKDASVFDAEMYLQRAQNWNALRLASDADVSQARVAVAELRILVELRAIVEVRNKGVDIAKNLLATKAITAEEFKQAVDALDDAKRRLAEWE